ncbi:MAG: hypothetical protein R8P61_05295 [Bacteroidia bacterium]|nr:hypothetical protein [Bacteroidia bacterium]
MQRLLLIFILAFLSQSCMLQGTPKTGDQKPGKADMYESFNKHRSLLIVYGSGAEKETEKYRQLANSLKERMGGGRRPLEIMIQSDQEYAMEQWKEIPGFLIGTPASNSLLARLNPFLPFQQSDSSFYINGQNFEEKEQAYQLSFFPNPDSQWTPITVVSGNSEQAVLNLLDRLTSGRRFRIWGSLPYQVYEDGKRIAMGDFDEDWKVDTELSWYFDPQPHPRFESAGIEIYEHSTGLEQEELERIGKKVLDEIEIVKSFWDTEKELDKISLNLYGSPEIMGMMKGEMKACYQDLDKNDVHILAHEYFPGLSKESQYLWILREITGGEANPVLQRGLAVYFSEDWQRKGHRYWTAKLFRSGDWQNIDELLANHSNEYASLITQGALSATLVEFLLEEWGKEIFLENYTSWSPAKKELKNLNKKWINYLSDLSNSITDEQREIELPPYLKGMTFAHEGYAVYNGYGSTLARKSLEEIKAHNVNTISIVPYSGLRETNKPNPVRFSRGSGGENDISVVYASRAAQNLGIKTMMKPQIWFGRSWPGDLEMQNQEDWDQFFSYYRTWILHYALLAEIHEFDLLCIGVEFVKASTQQPKAWAQLARDLKKIFSGKITYAANWGEEIEKLSPELSAELDFLGVDCYYPLSDKTWASDEDLKEGFKKTMKKLSKISKKHGKPLVFTEVGFRSIPEAWKEPHAEAKDDKALEEDQARCYQVVLEAMRDEDWQRGMIWWKWPSYMNYGNRSPQSFSPAGKMAAQVLKEYYGKNEIWE